MPMRFKLDYSCDRTSQERLQYLIDNVDFEKLTKKDLEICVDYVLYGRDPERDNTSAVDRHEVFIKTRYSSWQKTEPVSLEALLENPAFDEGTLKKEKYIYKKPKPHIDRDDQRIQQIPGMKELWEQIDKLARKIDLATGKIQPNEGEEVPQLDSKQLYHLKHWLIDLRKEQYKLKDTVIQEMAPPKNYGHYYNSPIDFQMNYPVFPCGIASKENDEDFKHPYMNGRPFAAKDLDHEIEVLRQNGKPYFNFLDKDHIYQLCLKYYEIKDFAEHYPDSPLHGLLDTLDYYIEKANLSEQQKLIVEGKKKRLLNKEICEQLMSQLGIYHQENYVSTIWNKACQLIADAADLHYDEWCCKDYKPAWKKCNCCGELLLRDPRNFVRKTKAPDGLTNRCKRCDQKKRRGEI